MQLIAKSRGRDYAIFSLHVTMVHRLTVSPLRPINGFVLSYFNILFKVTPDWGLEMASFCYILFFC